jgi:CheY-like chemotaxis protein
MPQREHHPTVVLVIGAEHDPIGPYLVACGCHVIRATSGAAAVALAQRHRPHLVIMDLDVENLDPYEMVIDLTALHETRDAPIVVVVSAPEDDEAIRPYCHGRLVRPGIEAALAATLAPHLARPAAEDTPRDPAVSAAPSDGADPLQERFERRLERLEREVARTQEALAGLYEQHLSLRQAAQLTEELAQPMTLVMGYAEMLPADLGDVGAARTDCEIITAQVKRMARTLGLLRRLVPRAGPAPPTPPTAGAAENGP